MNYYKIYETLISNAITRQEERDTYYEKHHILPKCIGGTDGESNIVKLLAREHYIAHQLLVKIHPDNIKLTHAAMMMNCANTSMKGRIASRNRIYGWLRAKYSKQISIKQQGKGNNQYGTIWVYSKELDASKKIKVEQLDTFLSRGWIRGRIINRKSNTLVSVCKFCKSSFIREFDAKLKHKRTHSKYCNPECRALHISKNDQTKKTIEDNITTIKEMHSNGISMNAICKHLGWVGAQGGYFNKLKSALS